MVEIAATGSSRRCEFTPAQLQQIFPNAETHAVRQVTEGEANILGKTRSTLLCSSAFIVCTAALCVLATLMGWVFDRRRDFAIMKALGASDRLIAMFVAGEAAALACVGAMLGFAARDWHRDTGLGGSTSMLQFRPVRNVSLRSDRLSGGNIGCHAAASAIAAPHSARYDFEGRIMIRLNQRQQILSGAGGSRGRHHSRAG